MSAPATVPFYIAIRLADEASPALAVYNVPVSSRGGDAV